MAGPFDYTVAPPALVAACFADGFEQFLDQRNLFKQRGGLGHRTLSGLAETQDGALFKHYTWQDWEETLPRRVERLKQYSRSNERKLFVVGSKGRLMPMGDVRMLSDSLRAFGCSSFDLLVINVVTGSPGTSPDIRILREDGFERITLWTLWLTGELRGATFQHADDRQRVRELFALIPKDLAVLDG